MVGEDLRHAQTCVSGPETHVNSCLRSSPPYFDFKKNKYFINCFSIQNLLDEHLRHA